MVIKFRIWEILSDTYHTSILQKCLPNKNYVYFTPTTELTVVLCLPVTQLSVA